MRAFVFLLLAIAAARPLEARTFTVLVYNVENLVDVDGQTLFDEYQVSRYTRQHCLTKLRNIAEIIAKFDGGRGADVILFSELEVDFTPGATPLDVPALLHRYADVTIEQMLGEKFSAEIADLPAEALLAKAMADRGMDGYRVIAAENVKAPESRTVLAQKCVVFSRFPVTATRSHATLDARAILEVRLEIEGAPLHVFANHWRSGASNPATEPARVANARTVRARLDEILRADPHADVVIGGDLNSHYDQKQRHPGLGTTGIDDVLGSQGGELAVRGRERALYNLWHELPIDERGSDVYRGEWGTLMHLLVSRGLYDLRGVQYVDNSFGVAKFPGLNMDAKGLPLRWTFEGASGAGYSDHFPVYAKFTVVRDGRTDRFLELKNPSVESPGPLRVRKIDYAKADFAAALTAKNLPAGRSLRRSEYLGKLVRVEGRVTADERLAVEFLGETYDVWSFDEALRDRLRAEHKTGEVLRFYGELGRYRDRWQFVIQDPSWVK